MAIYVKLGEKAESFFDPRTRIKVVKGVIVKVEGGTSPKLLKALKHGHLEKVSADEYEKSIKAVEVKPIEEKSLEFFKAMTKDEIIVWAKNFGFDEDDLTTLGELKKAKMPQFMVDTIPNYEDDGEPEDGDPEDGDDDLT